MQNLRQILIFLLELTCEATLLGILFCLSLILVGDMETPSPVALVFVFAPGIVIWVLFMCGYYFTRPILAVVWGKRPILPYAAVAAVLFAIQVSVFVARGWSDVSPEARRSVLPFLVGGTVIVFVCALAGRRCSLKWTRSASPGIAKVEAESEI